MTQQELLATVRERLRDVWPDANQRLWSDTELIDSYANAARDRLFLECRNLIIDSATPTDGELPLCRIPVVQGVASYAMSPKVIEIIRVKLGAQPRPLEKVTQAQLDQLYPDWQTATGEPRVWCPDLNTDSITIVPPPIENDTASLTVSRFPLKRLAIADNTITLGFREEYHEALIPWILHLAFSKKDPETNAETHPMAEYQRKLFIDRAVEIRAEVHRRLAVNHTIAPKRAFL